MAEGLPLYCADPVLFFVLVLSFQLLGDNYISRIFPQARRVAVQIARILPQLEESEEALRNACLEMQSSRVKMTSPGLPDDDLNTEEEEAELNRFIGETLSWMDRITRLKVDRDGLVIVLSKDTMRVLAHPDESLVGTQMDTTWEQPEDFTLDLRTVSPWADPENLEIYFNDYIPHEYASMDLSTLKDWQTFLGQSLYGCRLEYENTYIICGIPLLEWYSHLAINALLFSLIYLVLMWLLVKWICLEMDSRRETARSLRLKLISYSIILCVVLFGVSWYSQTLTDMTNDLKTMSKHAEVAVETLETYDTQRKKLNNWLDSYYEDQCRLAAAMAEKDGKKI